MGYTARFPSQGKIKQDKDLESQEGKNKVLSPQISNHPDRSSWNASTQSRVRECMPQQLPLGTIQGGHSFPDVSTSSTDV